MRHEGLRAGIAGCSGYAGGELVRLLAMHPQVQITLLTSRTYAGKTMDAVFPGFAGLDLPVVEVFDPATAASRVDVLFTATENGYAMQHARALLDAGVRVIDISADFRLRDPDVYSQWYRMPHADIGLLQEAVYGLPELTDRAYIASARLVANPGCYPTAAALALAPAVEAGLVRTDNLLIDAKSGVSGAGRSKFGLPYHFAELNEGMKAYGVPSHRHTPEIEQTLSGVAHGSPVRLTFSPSLAPITRGILCCAYADLVKPLSAAELTEVYRTRYGNERFITVREPGDFPSTKATYGVNQCQMAVTVDERTNRMIAVSVIDNLVKGAAGQAVQNMNIMFGFPESEALDLPAVYP